MRGDHWQGQEVILCNLVTQGLNGKRGRVREAMPVGDRYAVDVEGGRTLMIRPGNLKIAPMVKGAKSEWIAWNPPDEIVQCAHEAAGKIDAMIGEQDRSQADVGRLRAASINMFQSVWQALIRDRESSLECKTLESLKRRAGGTARLAIDQLEELILRSERWMQTGDDGSRGEVITCCARCMEDAIQDIVCTRSGQKQKGIG